MKKLYFLLFSLMGLLSFGQDLIITGIIDGPLPGGTPKGLELYVANNIADLSVYGLESTTNGAAAAGQEYTFPADAATAGSFIYVATESTNFAQYLGVNPTYTDGVIAVNGDDTVILYKNGAVEDSIGEIGVDGTGTAWDHLDGWAYRVDGFGPNATFSEAEWTFSGANALDGCDLADDTGTNAGCASVFPIGTYSPNTNTNPTITITSPGDAQAFDSGTTTVDVEFSTANAPGATVNITVTTNGGTPVTTNGVTSPFTISPTADGDTFSVSVDLVDGGVLDSDMVDFSIAFPCDIQVGTITATCDNITPASTDTYNVTIDYTGGATTTYTIDTGGVGTVGGDNPTSVADGTITITGITEGTDFTVTFTGDSANSSCDFTRSINSPDCDPSLPLPLYEGFDYTVAQNLGDQTNWTDFNSGDNIVIGGPGGLTYPGLADGNQTGNHLSFDGSGAESKIEFTPVTTGKIYTSFIVNITDISTITDLTDGGYIAALAASDSGYDARVWVRPEPVPSSTSDNQGGGPPYEISITTLTSGANGAPFIGSYFVGDAVLIVLSYEPTTGALNGWVNPGSLGGAEPAADFTETDSAPAAFIDRFVLRQDSANETPSVLFDELRIGTSWAEVTPQTLSNDEFSLDKVAIYPNPSDTGFVTITSTSNDLMNIQIFDILGKQVKNEILTNNTLNVSNLKSGVYIVKMTQNNASTTKKLVIK
ncbi:T9SS type A sorting domain-containing protein [uncultured Winogradskyella sp.]|uniref:T9SS type A sorting domain-containing protein n=1 Tax=uncultured Winogradskyella sp. TaxID=395353 RepID=UPI002603EA45|nr:T9SS type A sorting domain-containing protein [uncultured Winogradskyella sp.]